MGISVEAYPVDVSSPHPDMDDREGVGVNVKHLNGTGAATSS